MAKGLRASTRKRNNAKLRATVFGPAYDARTERLSAKLQEIASQPRLDQERVMEVDNTEDKDKPSPNAGTEEMQVDGQSTRKNTSSAPRGKAHPSRIEKKKQARKNRSSIVFPTNAQHKKRKAASKKKGRQKQDSSTGNQRSFCDVDQGQSIMPDSKADFEQKSCGWYDRLQRELELRLGEVSVRENIEAKDCVAAITPVTLVVASKAFSMARENEEQEEVSRLHVAAFTSDTKPYVTGNLIVQQLDQTH